MRAAILGLAIFDLDNTLLGGDSDYLWTQFLVERGLVDKAYERENRRFYQRYQAGTLDIHAFLRFQLRPLAERDPSDLYAWREEFLTQKIQPIILPAARELLQKHRTQGDTLLIATSTNRFITEPIAGALGVENLLATEPEMADGRYTGRVSGIPCFREGKVQRLEQWLRERAMSLDDSGFYSDSHNDIPLLERVTRPVAVDPDAELARHAKDQGWPIISLR